MSMQDYEKALALIESAGTGDFEGAKPESLVAKAEVVLGVMFPPSYRRFLLELGCGDFNGVEIYGLVGDNFTNGSIPNGIWLTLDERFTNNLLPIYVLISSGGDGTYYAIDTSEMSINGENPVVLLSMDGGSVEMVAESFGSYFLDEVSSVV